MKLGIIASLCFVALLAAPPAGAQSNSSAFVDQIGDRPAATIAQTAANARAEVTQDGSRNEVIIGQRGDAAAVAIVSQKGDSNLARLSQGGSGHNIARVAQAGNGNTAWVDQTAAGALSNYARISQNGDRNAFALVQDGSDNRALLSQTGDDNGMTATQIGEGNRLAWSQQGNELTDLNIVQSGGAAIGGQLLITQNR